MSHAAAAHSKVHDHAPEAADLSTANTTWSGGKALSGFLILAGLALIGLTIAGGFQLGVTHALAAYHIGAMTCLALALGCLFWVMGFHLTGAGWAVTVRRQFENVMKLLPVAVFMVAPVLFIEMWQGGHLFAWMNPQVLHEDVLLSRKAGYLNPMFFTIRAVVYFLVWTYLSWRLWTYSKEQDATANKWLTNKARFTSSWGMPLFALSTAFAAFDWLMSMDYRFFSTMWGVYYFAGAVFCSVPLIVIIVGRLRAAGKLKGLVTEEHLHDMAKLMFAFTVFWTYIGFSQYFLIWYANVPEETAFFVARKSNGWEHLSKFLVFGHFVVPFYLLLWRQIRRSFALLSIMALWAIVIEMVDLYWIVRPFVYAADPVDKIHMGGLWLDIVGVLGPVCLFLGLVVRQVGRGPLIPIHDPRLNEAIEHKNYV